MANQKQQPLGPSIGTVANESRGFNGVDLYHPKQDLTGNLLLQADNVYNIAGQLFSRPGYEGQLAAPLSDPSYKLTAWYDTDGTAWLLFTSGGKIYKLHRGDDFATELKQPDGTTSYNISSATAGASDPVNGFVYIWDGANALIRINLSGGSTIYSMAAPTSGATVSLTSQFIAAMWNATQWGFDGQSTPYGTEVNGDFNNAQWVVTNRTGPFYSNFISLVNSNVNICLTGGSDSTGGYLAIPALSGNSSLYPSRYHMTMQAAKDGPFHGQPNNYAGVMTVSAFDPSHTFLASIDFVFNPPQSPSTSYNLVTNLDYVFDFSGVSVSIAYVKIEIQQAVNGASGNLWVNNINFTPVSVQTAIVSGTTGTVFLPSVSGNAIPIAGSSSSSSGSSSIPSVNTQQATDLGSLLDYEGTSFTFTFPVSGSSSSSSGSSSGVLVGGVDLSSTDRLTIGLSGVAAWSGLSFALYLGLSDGSSLLADNGVTISADQTYLFCDISTLSATLRMHVVSLKLTFLSDPTWVSPYSPLTIGPLQSPGNLSIGLADYTYYYTEIHTVAVDDVVESNPSPASLPVTPTMTQAEADVDLNAPVNSTTITGFRIYRLGGALTDTLLVAEVPVDADVTTILYTWNHITRTFIDNTPDIDMFGNALMVTGRDVPPTMPQAGASFQGRIWLAQGNSLYGSWQKVDNTSALYFTLVNSPNDPNLLIEGFTDQIGNDNTDPIVALVTIGVPAYSGNPFGGALLILKARSVFVLQGDTPADFKSTQLDYQEGVGLIAQKGYARVDANNVLFMGPDRIHSFPLKSDSSPTSDIGLLIQPALYPRSPSTLQNAEAFSKSWMEYHDNRFYVGVPVPGETSNSVVWIYDLRVKGWTRWLGFNATSAISVAPQASDGSDYVFFWFGLNGQIYQCFGTADLAIPTADPVAITGTATVHGLRPGFLYRYKLHPLFYRDVKLVSLLIESQMNGTITASAQGDDPAQAYSAMRIFDGARVYGWIVPVPNGQIIGEVITVTVTWTLTTQAMLRGVRGEVAETRIYR